MVLVIKKRWSINAYKTSEGMDRHYMRISRLSINSVRLRKSGNVWEWKVGCIFCFITIGN